MLLNVYLWWYIHITICLGTYNWTYPQRCCSLFLENNVFACPCCVVSVSRVRIGASWVLMYVQYLWPWRRWYADGSSTYISKYMWYESFQRNPSILSAFDSKSDRIVLFSLQTKAVKEHKQYIGDPIHTQHAESPYIFFHFMGLHHRPISNPLHWDA